MNSALRISEAASIAIHSMVYMARQPEKLHSTKEIAEFLKVSNNHLSKVLQRLSKGNLVKSNRGPKGGFMLAVPAESITLLAIYESIEGELKLRDCLFETRICKGNGCIFGGQITYLNRALKEHLSKTSLSDTKDIYGGELKDEKGNNRNR